MPDSAHPVIASEVTSLPNVWKWSRGYLHKERMAVEASVLARKSQPPATLSAWQEHGTDLRAKLEKKFRLDTAIGSLDPIVHGEVRCKGYSVQNVTFHSHAGIRVTGNLYIPEGQGPFPAVLNCHGHYLNGKIAPEVQARGHVLAQRGFVVLTTDAPGAGERGDDEHKWVYHGALAGASLFLSGDSLMGWQIRDNRRALDFLVSLPFVDHTRLGVTGESGGGGQTMWIGAMDERLRVSVPVVSVGSFESFVTNCNCICETLPGGLSLTEEWGILALTAPRSVLVLNAIKDSVTFGPDPMTRTCRLAQEIYDLHGVSAKFDFRSLNLTHGYWPDMLRAMLGWMEHMLMDAPSGAPQEIPHYTPPERCHAGMILLLCGFPIPSPLCPAGLP